MQYTRKQGRIRPLHSSSLRHLDWVGGDPRGLHSSFCRSVEVSRAGALGLPGSCCARQQDTGLQGGAGSANKAGAPSNDKGRACAPLDRSCAEEAGLKLSTDPESPTRDPRRDSLHQNEPEGHTFSTAARPLLPVPCHREEPELRREQGARIR